MIPNFLSFSYRGFEAHMATSTPGRGTVRHSLRLLITNSTVFRWGFIMILTTCLICTHLRELLARLVVCIDQDIVLIVSDNSLNKNRCLVRLVVSINQQRCWSWQNQKVVFFLLLEQQDFIVICGHKDLCEKKCNI